MMRMTWASFMRVLKKMLIRALYGAYVIVAERKDATATITETVPRQRSGSGNSIEMPMQKKRRRGRVMQDDGVIPVAGFPRVDGMATRNSQRTTRTRGNTWFNSYIASICSRTSSRGYTFEAGKRDSSYSVQSRGSRRSRDVRSGSRGTWRR